jgi:hypothetical protein
MNLAHQNILLTLDVIAGKLAKKSPPEPPPVCAQPTTAGATATALAVAMKVGEGQVQVISFRGKLLISVLLSNDSMNRLAQAPIDLGNMCVFVSKFVDVPIYFWSGAGWSTSVEGGSLCVQSGTTPTPWVCAEDQLEN